jgi:hypothetical protein
MQSAKSSRTIGASTLVAMGALTLWSCTPREAAAPVLEFAVVTDPGRSARAIDFVPYGRGLERVQLHLGNPVRFAVARAWVTVPCYTFHTGLSIQIDEPDARRFDAWAAEQTGRDVAALVDGRVCMVAPSAYVVASRMYLSGGAGGFSTDELERMVHCWNPVR